MATDLRIEADNRVGQLATLSEELGKVGVNIDGFCATVADGRGVLHVLVENAGAARQALVGAGYTIAAEREALVLESVEDRPGYLGEMARRLADADVNIEVAYLA
ncbi:MAG: ACT domain-containing protein, partial [Acidimicrobiales bacterium]